MKFTIQDVEKSHEGLDYNSARGLVAVLETLGAITKVGVRRAQEPAVRGTNLYEGTVDKMMDALRVLLVKVASKTEGAVPKERQQQFEGDMETMLTKFKSLLMTLEEKAEK